MSTRVVFFLFSYVMIASSVLSAEEAQKILSEAAAVWHFDGLKVSNDKNLLQAQGEVVRGPELKESLARGGDGKVVEIRNGWLEVGQRGDERLNLNEKGMTLLLRLHIPQGKLPPGQMLSQNGVQDKSIFNLYTDTRWIGFELVFEDRSVNVERALANISVLGSNQWHDLIIRYNGKELVMFVDGFLVAKKEITGSLRKGNASPLKIGSGMFDHLALWSRALSDQEIVTLSGGQKVVNACSEAMKKMIIDELGREGMTTADQQRGTRELREKLWNDPQRPRYHLMPPEGFWNDINGTVYWKGRYHVFYLGRLAPDLNAVLSGKDTSRSREAWFHSSSSDLVHWIHHPPALVPVFDGSMPSGIYSGDMMDNMPVPTIIVHIPGQGTCLYTAQDDELIHWKPNPKNPVIPSSSVPPEVVSFDPAGWKEGDHYYALLGNKNRTPGYEGDSTSLYRSSDLEHWEYRGPFYKSERRWTAEYEDCACPDFFPLGDKYMLISHIHKPWNRLQYYIGNYDKKAERFLPESHGYMSWPGGSLCAPETLLDDKGRRIFWGWIMENGPTVGWGSVATLPRILSLDGDQLHIEPAPELKVLRCNPQHLESQTVSGEMPLEAIHGDCKEITLDIEPGDAKEFGIKVRCSPDLAEETTIIYSPAEKSLKIEFGKSTINERVKYNWITIDDKLAKEYKLPIEKRFAKEQVTPFELNPGEPLRLRIFLDRSVLEVYANERQCITQRIYPTRADSMGIRLITRGGSAKLKSLDAWDLSPTHSW